MNMIQTFIFIIFIAQIDCTLVKRPIRIFHGLGDSCNSFPTQNPDYEHCVETGEKKDSVFNSIEDQAKIGCLHLIKEKELLKNGFYVVAYSQGGLIARMIFQRCTLMQGLIKRIVFIGTPQLGVKELPGSEAFTEDPKKSRDFTTFMQDVGIGIINTMGIWADVILESAPTNYLTDEDGYSILIAQINDPVFDPLYSKLEFVLNIFNRNEKVVRPKTSVLFGAKITDKDGKSVEFGQLPKYYLKHSKGIGSLWEHNRMFNCISETKHASILNNEYNVVSLLLTDDLTKNTYEESIIQRIQDFTRSYPNFCQFESKQKQKVLSGAIKPIVGDNDDNIFI